MNENLKTVSKLLSDFDAFIDNRSMVVSVWSEEVFHKILEWHFGMWEKEHEHGPPKDCSEGWENHDAWEIYNEILRTLGSCLQKIERRALRERQSLAFFEALKKHVERYKGEFVENKNGHEKRYYIEYLFGMFYQVFLEEIGNSPEKHNIWRHHFPLEWKITLNNLEKENSVSRFSLKRFLDWTQERIEQIKDGSDRNWNDVVINLFPDVNPILWKEILILIFSLRYGDCVQSVIEGSWNFNFVFSSTDEIRTNNTFKLVRSSFPGEFSKKNLKGYLDDLRKLKYEADSGKDNKRSRLLIVFEKILEIIEVKPQ